MRRSGAIFTSLIAAVFSISGPLDVVAGKNDPVFRTQKTAVCLKLGERSAEGGVPGSDGWKLTKPCCKPLVDRTAADNCPNTLLGGYVYVCLACGDGKCDGAHENKCNCPEDCK